MGTVADIKTWEGDDLDSYCNTIDSELRDLLTPITDRTVRAEGPRKEGYIDHPYYIEPFPVDQIPSETQRRAFEMMRTLLSWAESFTGTLRYDVQVSHEDCEYHDEWAARKIEQCKAAIAAI